MLSDKTSAALLDAAVKAPEQRVRGAILAFFAAVDPRRAAKLAGDFDHPLHKELARHLVGSAPAPDDLVPDAGNSAGAETDPVDAAVAELIAELVVAAPPPDGVRRDARAREVLRLAAAGNITGLPVDRLLRAHGAADALLEPVDLGFVLSRAGSDPLGAAFARSLADPDSARRLATADLLSHVTRAVLTPFAYLNWPDRWADLSPEYGYRSFDTTVTADGGVFDETTVESRPAPPPPPASSAVQPTAAFHPRIDGPGAVVVDTEFGVRIGVGRRRDRSILGTGGFDLPADTPVDLELLVTYDPDSLEAKTELPRTLRIQPGAAEAYVEARFVAKDGELARERRIGVHYLRNGTVVGIAWKRFLAVPEERELASAQGPDPRERALLDLGPLVGEQRPDVVVAVYKADAASGDRFLWAAYPSGADLAVPDTERSSAIGDEAKQFATEIRRVVTSDGDAHATYLALHGRGVQIGWAVPAAMQSLLRRVAANPARGAPASVLLLTEEAHIPWELAVLDPPVTSPSGGDSPFLGSHLAIARWPLTEHGPLPVPRDAVHVRQAALLFGRYEGVKGWGRLTHAEEESEHIRTTYPPAEVIEPRFATVVDALRGSPAAEMLHVALHGQFDPDGAGTGLVLLKERDGALVPQFLTPDQIVALRVPGTFVFLNACQVGAGKEVLGNYAGLATALLRAGAVAVLAPLWSVDDQVAGSVAREFYAAVFGDPPVSAAEALCRIRRSYTESAARAGSAKAAESTRLAYQLFGHPRLRLTRRHAVEPVAPVEPVEARHA